MHIQEYRKGALISILNMYVYVNSGKHLWHFIYIKIFCRNFFSCYPAKKYFFPGDFVEALVRNRRVTEVIGSLAGYLRHE